MAGGTTKQTEGPMVGGWGCSTGPPPLRGSAPLTARLQPTSPPTPLQGRCVPLRSTPLPVPWRRDGLVTRLPSREGATVLFVNKAVVRAVVFQHFQHRSGAAQMAS